MNFAEKVKNLRINANLTQQELSKYLGISASAIGYLENGQRDPTGSTLIAYAKYFNVSIDSLVGLEPDIEDSIFSTTPTAPLLSQEEQRLIEDYRELAPALRELLQATIRTWKKPDANTNVRKKLK